MTPVASETPLCRRLLANNLEDPPAKNGIPNFRYPTGTRWAHLMTTEHEGVLVLRFLGVTGFRYLTAMPKAA